MAKNISHFKSGGLGLASFCVFNLCTELAFNQQILNCKYYKAQEDQCWEGSTGWFVQFLKKDAKPELQTVLVSWALGQGHLVQALCKVDETYQLMLCQYSCS